MQSDCTDTISAHENEYCCLFTCMWPSLFITTFMKDSLTVALYAMLFQFKICSYCEHFQIEALSSALTLKDLTETEWGRWEEGTGGSCWVSADGLTQFQGTQWSQRLISKRQIVILSSIAPVWWVHLLCRGCTQGKRPGPKERTTLWWTLWWEGIGSETVWNAFQMHWNENRAGSYGCHWNLFKKALNWFWPDWVGEQAGIEWIDPDNDAVALVTDRGPWSPGLLPPVLVLWTPTPQRPPITTETHIHPSSTSIISPSFRLWVYYQLQVPPLHAVLQLQSCLHRLKRQPIWQQLNTSTHTRHTHTCHTHTRTVLCKQTVHLTPST